MPKIYIIGGMVAVIAGMLIAVQHAAPRPIPAPGPAAPQRFPPKIPLAQLPEPASSLKISVSIVSSAGNMSRQLQIMFQNAGEKDVLLPLGLIAGDKAYPSGIEVLLTTPDGKQPQVLYTGIATVAGREDPLVIPLLSGADYTLRIPTDKYFVLGSSAKFDTFISQPGELQIKLDTTNAHCPPYGYPNPNMVTCWQGKLTSNTLHFPN